VLRRVVTRLFVDNAPLKALAFVITLTLYLFVRGDRPSEAVLDVPLIYRLPSDRVLMTMPVERLRVAVRGPWTRLSRLDPADLEGPVTIDLQNVPSGEFRFDPAGIPLPRGLRVATVSPAAMRVEFEPRVVRSLPVEPRLSGPPPPGFVVQGFAVTPDEVTVAGAQSVVESLRHVTTAPLAVQGAHRNLDRRVDLAPLPRHADYLDAHPVRVEVRIAPAPAGSEAAGPPAASSPSAP
jgi:YbbR domain-containing protein